MVHFTQHDVLYRVRRNLLDFLIRLLKLERYNHLTANFIGAAKPGPEIFWGKSIFLSKLVIFEVRLVQKL